MTKALNALLIALGLAAAVQGQAVQQPVFQAFTTNTTVTVPDQGSALLGGVDRAQQGSVSRGVPILGKLPGVGRLFNNRAIGQDFSSSRNHVRAQIIDLNEMDRALLNQVPSAAASGVPITQNRTPASRQNRRQRAADFLVNNLGRHSAAPQDRNIARPARRGDTPAHKLLALGDQAMDDGQLDLATRYYRAAERVAKSTSTTQPETNVANRQPASAQPLVLKN